MDLKKKVQRYYQKVKRASIYHFRVIRIYERIDTRTRRIDVNAGLLKRGITSSGETASSFHFLAD